MASFSWGTPGIDIPPPTSDSDNRPVPKRFSDLRFDPQGVYDLRRMLGALPQYPGQYMGNKERFDAADVAWLAHGCSVDGRHMVAHDEFHPVLANMYTPKLFGPESRHKIKEITQKLVFDSATLWDRAFGGSTIVIHVEGATSPGTPALPEYVRAQVYLPPSTVVAELPDAHEPVAKMVQMFIEHVGVPTQMRWERVGKRSLGWTLKGNTNTMPQPLPRHSVPIPSPLRRGSSIYTFHGQPFSPSAPSSVSSLSTHTSISTALAPACTNDGFPPPASDDDMYADDDRANITSSFIAALNTLDWENERNLYEDRERVFKEQIRDLEEEVSSLQEEIARLRDEVANSRRAAASPAPRLLSPRSHFPVRSPSPGPYILPSAPLASPFARMGTPKRNPKQEDPPTPAAPPPSQLNLREGSPFAKMGTPKRKLRQEDPGTPVTSKKPIKRAPHSAVKLSAAPVCAEPSTSTRAPSSRNPRASLLALSMGYTDAHLGLLELVVTHVKQPLWYMELSRYGFKHEDIHHILLELTEDIA